MQYTFQDKKILIKRLYKKIFFKLLNTLKINIKTLLKFILNFMRFIHLGYFVDYILSLYAKFKSDSITLCTEKNNTYYYKSLNKLDLHYKFSSRSKLIYDHLKNSVKQKRR